MRSITDFKRQVRYGDRVVLDEDDPGVIVTGTGDCVFIARPFGKPIEEKYPINDAWYFYEPPKPKVVRYLWKVWFEYKSQPEILPTFFKDEDDLKKGMVGVKSYERLDYTKTEDIK